MPRWLKKVTRAVVPGVRSHQNRKAEKNHARQVAAETKVAQASNTQAAVVTQAQVTQQQVVIEETKQQLEAIVPMLAQVDVIIDDRTERLQRHARELELILQETGDAAVRAAFVNYFVQMNVETLTFFITHVRDAFLSITNLAQKTPVMVDVLQAEVQRRNAEPVTIAWRGHNAFFLTGAPAAQLAAIEDTRAGLAIMRAQ